MNNIKTKILDLSPNILPLKLKILYYIKILEKIDKNDYLVRLLSNYNEVDKFLTINHPSIIKFLYYNREYIQKSILKKSDKIIPINFLNDNNNLRNYFYLDLLISDDLNYIHYSYTIDYINKINKEISYLQKEQKNKFKLIILSKIIIELIINYQENDNNEEESKLMEIINEKKIIIKKNINIFNEINLNLTVDNITNEYYINTKKIDKLYIDIIIALIKEKKIDDYNYSMEIINQLELENIDLTKTMFDELKNMMDTKYDYIKDYIIAKIEDLIN